MKCCTPGEKRSNSSRALAGFFVRMIMKLETRIERAALVAAVLCCAALYPVESAAQQSEIGSLQRSGPENYRIGAGDVLDVIVGNNDTLSRRGIRVSNQGMIQLAMLDNDVLAACRTERELADQIREKYRKYLLQPHINVAVKEFNSTPVAVIGAVNSPGRFQLQRPVRLLEMLTLVNGPSVAAGRTLQMIRNPRALVGCETPEQVEKDPDESELRVLALGETLKGSEEANPYVQSGDIIRIPDAEQAFIHGNIRNAMAINLKEPVTLSQAIVMAGGLAPDAAIEKIKIVRQEPGTGAKTTIVANLKEIRKQDSKDIFLQPNDLVEVPGPTGTKKFFKDILRTIVPTFTQLPFRVIP